MKKAMSRAHADYLKRCYMSIGLDHDVMLGLQSQRAQAYDLVTNIHAQVTTQDKSANESASLYHCSCANS